MLLCSFLQTLQVKSAASTEKNINIDIKSVELQSENRSIKLVSISLDGCWKTYMRAALDYYIYSYACRHY